MREFSGLFCIFVWEVVCGGGCVGVCGWVEAVCVFYAQIHARRYRGNFELASFHLAGSKMV